MNTLAELEKFVANGQAATDAATAAGPAPVEEPTPPRAQSPTPLLCREHVREFLLDAARQHRRFNKFSRVSENTLVAANAMLRQWLVSRVKAAPSKGVTL